LIKGFGIHKMKPIWVVIQVRHGLGHYGHTLHAIRRTKALFQIFAIKNIFEFGLHARHPFAWGDVLSLYCTHVVKSLAHWKNSI
jgi:hypothetical protein